MKTKEISSHSPKNKFRCEIAYNKSLKDVGSVESFGAMTLEEIESGIKYREHNIKSGKGARVVIRENKEEYPYFDWRIVKETNIVESNKSAAINDKTVTTRIPQEMWEWLIETGGTAGGAVRAILDEFERVHQQGNEVFMIAENLANLQQIRRYSLNEIKGKFSPAEWSYMADSLNGTMVTTEFRCSFGALAISIKESDTFDGFGEKWKVDVPGLIDKINKLTGAQVDAVFTRINEFWYSEDKDMETWSKW